MINNIFENKTKNRIKILCVFICALCFRILIINTTHINILLPDEGGYFTLAYNLAENNKYSLNDGTKHFFREPVHPSILAVSFYISRILGNEIESIKFNKDRYAQTGENEIIIAKYLQTILDSISAVIFFIILSYILKPNIAFIVALLYAFYYPNANHTAYLLRETAQTFFSMLVCLFVLLYARKGKLKYVFTTGIAIGFLILTFFSASIILLAIPIVFLLIHKNIIKTIIPTLILIAMCFLTIMPWLIRTYSEIGDIRVIKSFGTSNTFEIVNYHLAIYKAHNNGVISLEDRKKLTSEWFAMNCYDKFRYSFDGTFKKRADSLQALYYEPFFSKRNINQIFTNITRTWFPWPTKILREINNDFKTNSFELIKNNILLSIFLVMPIYLIGLFSLWGIIKYFLMFKEINIIFVYLIIGIVSGDEGRRTLPIVPFIFLYGVLGIINLYYKNIKKIKNENIKQLLFLKYEEKTI